MLPSWSKHSSVNSMMSKRSVHKLTCEDSLKKRARGHLSVPIVPKHFTYIFGRITPSVVNFFIPRVFLLSSENIRPQKGKRCIMVELWERGFRASRLTESHKPLCIGSKAFISPTHRVALIQTEITISKLGGNKNWINHVNAGLRPKLFSLLSQFHLA